MSKLIALAVLAAALLIPSAAGAATATKLHGVVVAKESARHVLVLASSRGKVTSARVTTRQLRSTRLGARLALVGTKLADGSLRVTRLQRLGLAKQARLRVVVLKAGGSKLLVAGGGSAFAIRVTRATRVLAATGSDFKPGEQVSTEVDLGENGAVGNTVQTLGNSVLIDFSGTITALDPTSITISSDGVTTVVAIPDGVTLPALVQVGSEVEIVASVSGSTLTLVEINLDGENGDSGGSSVGNDASVHVEGFVTALDASSITIQPGDNASPVTFAIPSGFTLPSGLAAGSQVDAKGDVVNGVMTLSELELQNDGGDQSQVETEGTVTALDSSSITIQPGDNGTPLTFAIPSGFTLPDGLQVGSVVDAKGDTVGGVLTLTSLDLQQQDNGGMQIEGTVTALDSTSITVQSSSDGGSTQTFAIPSGFTLPDGLQVGSSVDAQGEFQNGVLTLTEIELQDSGGDGGGDGGSGGGSGGSDG